MNNKQLETTLLTIKNYVDTTTMNHFVHTAVVDVNTLKTTGIYSLTSNCTNNATANAGTMIVDFNVGTPYQLWIPDNTHTFYKRNWDKANSVWKSWSNKITGDITGNADGNAGTATKLKTARTISISGDATGSTSFDGSGNVTIDVSIDGKGNAGSADKVNNPMTIQLNSGTKEGTNKFTFDGSAAKSVNITPGGIGAYTKSEVDTKLGGKSNTGHTHDDRYFTETEVTTKLSELSSSIDTKLEGKADSSHGTHVTYATVAPKAAGTAAVGTSGKVAREDHVHPVQTSVSGNAGTATKFQSAQSVTLSGDVIGTASSQAGWSVETELASTGVTAGSYGPSANATPGYNSTFNVPYITVDEKGRITSASTKTVKIPASDNSDTKVKSTLSTNTKFHLTGTTATATATGEQYFDTGVYVSTNAGELVATKFKGALEGNVTGNLTGTATNATQAEQDSAGQEISTTYIKGLSVSGKTITYTKGDGTKGTITTQDTNTDTKVTNTLATTTKAYVTGTTSATTSTGTQVFDTGVYLDTTAGQLTATKFKGALEGNVTGNVTGNATTATTLATVRTINGTNFDGSANITTTNWGTARTLTIGASGKSVNGSGNVSWTLNDIGAAKGKTASATTAAKAQWYRIATSVSGINRNFGTFTIEATVSGKHSITQINAGTCYGQNPILQQISHTAHSATGISKARIVYHTTYEGNYAYLEVYLPSATATVINVHMSDYYGWSLVTPNTVGSIPSGYKHVEKEFVSGKIVSDIKGSLDGTATKVGNQLSIQLNSGTATKFDGSAAKSINITPEAIGASASNHDHNYAGSSTPGGAATSANKVNKSLTLQFNGTTNATFDGSSARTVNITPSAIGAYTKGEVDKKVSSINSTATANLAAAKTYADQKIAALVDSAPDALNTLNELATAIQEHGDEYEAYVASVSAQLAGKADKNHGTHLTLGNGSGNAYRGDHGLIAYNHSKAAHAPVNAQPNADITKDEIEAKLTGNITTHTHSYLPLSGGTMSGAITSSLTSGAALIIAKPGTSKHRTMVFASTNDGEHIFGGNNIGTTEMKDFIRVGVNKFTYETNGNVYNIYHAGNKPSASDIGAAPSSHNHSAANITSGTLSVDRLGNSGVKAGSYGLSANATPAYGGTFNVPYITVDAKGRVTGASNKTVTIPALGETESTAYRGDRGKIAYNHSQAAHAPSNAQKNSDITKAEIEAKLTGAITTHTHSYVPLSGGTVTGNLILSGAGVQTTKAYDGTTAYNATPLGISYTQTDGDDNGTASIYSTTLTVNQSINRQFQICVNNGGNILAFRGAHVNNTGGTGDGWTAWKKVYHEGNKPSASDVGAYSKSEVDTKLNGKANTHNHPYLSTSGGTITGGLIVGSTVRSDTALTDDLGSSSIPWKTVYAKALGLRGSSSGTTYGSMDVITAGTASAVGETMLIIGNNVASGTANNAKGVLRMYGTSSGQTNILVGNNTTSNINLTLPSAAGTLARTADNVASATKLKTPRNITLTGDVNGSAKFDGSADISITATVADNSHSHSDYLPKVGGTMTGNITFADVTSTTYPAKSNMITWNGSTDGADIYYQVDASDKGRLVFNTRDDADCIFAFANKGTVHTTIDNSGNFSGTAAKANQLATARNITIGNKTNSFNGKANISFALADIGAAAASHTHNYAGSSSAGGAANSVKNDLVIKLNSGSTEGTNLFTFNGSTAKTINITPSAIGAAAASHGTHLTLGTGSGNAYRGDHGLIAYNHSKAAHAPSNAQKNSDITSSEIQAKLTGKITTHYHLTDSEVTTSLTNAFGASYIPK